MPKHISTSTLLVKLTGEDRSILKAKCDQYDRMDFDEWEKAIKEIRKDIDTAKGTLYWDGSYIIRRRLELRYLIKIEREYDSMENCWKSEYHDELLVPYGIN